MPLLRTKCAAFSVVNGSDIAGQMDDVALVDSASVEEIAYCCQEDDGNELGDGIREKDLMAEEGKCVVLNYGNSPWR